MTGDVRRHVSAVKGEITADVTATNIPYSNGKIHVRTASTFSDPARYVAVIGVRAGARGLRGLPESGKAIFFGPKTAA